MQRSLVVLVAVMLALGWCPIKAQAANYSLSASGTLATLTSDNNSNLTGCGTIAGDSYDNFCPSGSCVCITYSGKISGNLTGTDPAGALHITVDDGGDPTPNCKPVFGELIFSGTGDKETIYLNGSRCPPSAKKGVVEFSGGGNILVFKEP